MSAIADAQTQTPPALPAAITVMGLNVLVICALVAFVCICYKRRQAIRLSTVEVRSLFCGSVSYAGIIDAAFAE